MVRPWCVRGAFRRSEAASRVFDRIVARRFLKRCAAMRPRARFAAFSVAKCGPARAPCAHHFMARA
eukprot:562552-Lingulodinium_polyedra.AAC.1